MCVNRDKEEYIVKTHDSYFYRKFTLLCVVNNSKCV